MPLMRARSVDSPRFDHVPFDYVKIMHEGHNEISQSRKSNIDMSNANGEGWYRVTVTAYYN